MEGQLDLKDLELNALLEITQAINNNLSETDLYRIYRFTLLGDLKINKLAMYVYDNDWRCKVNYGVKESFERIGLPAQYHDLIDTLQVNTEDEFNEFDIVFPVQHKKKLLAVVFIGGLNKKELIDSTFLRALTNILIVAIENKKLVRRQFEQESYRKELEIAKKVQNFLFPKSLPQTPRLKIEAVYLPHRDVGGDYYDYIPLSENKFVICIADVSGKGVPAALLMSNFQASLRIIVRKTQDLEEIITELNHATYINSDGENFITMFIGIYDFDNKEFSFGNCGHNPSILFHEDGMIMLDEGTTILGMFDPLPFISTKTISNLSKFTFFGYTDGLTETFSPEDEQFGLDRLIVLLEEYKDIELKLLHEFILKALDDFRFDKEYNDDITMISCQVSPK